MCHLLLSQAVSHQVYLTAQHTKIYLLHLWKYEFELHWKQWAKFCSKLHQFKSGIISEQHVTQCIFCPESNWHALKEIHKWTKIITGVPFFFTKMEDFVGGVVIWWYISLWCKKAEFKFCLRSKSENEFGDLIHPRYQITTVWFSLSSVVLRSLFNSGSGALSKQGGKRTSGFAAGTYFLGFL